MTLNLVILASEMLHALFQVERVKTAVLPVGGMNVLPGPAHAAKSSLKRLRFVQDFFEGHWHIISLHLRVVNRAGGVLNLNDFIILLNVDRGQDLIQVLELEITTLRCCSILTRLLR